MVILQFGSGRHAPVMCIRSSLNRCVNSLHPAPGNDCLVFPVFHIVLFHGALEGIGAGFKVRSRRPDDAVSLFIPHQVKVRGSIGAIESQGFIECDLAGKRLSEGAAMAATPLPLWFVQIFPSPY